MFSSVILKSITKCKTPKYFSIFNQSSPSCSRFFSNLPEETVYGGPKHQSPSKRFTLRHVEQKYKAKQPITMVTAYDYPSAVHVDMAGIDICLVGDSAAMVVHGHDTTLPITLEEMLVHCRAVSRGAKRPLLMGDLPFGSFEKNSTQAIESCTRMLKEGNMDCVKMEGGGEGRVDAVRSSVHAGIAVMGHIGLTPQAISVLGGFRPQGGTAHSAIQLLEQAKALEQAGCFGLVLECLPAPVSAIITKSISIPTIGIGAGPFCSGQVLVYHDLLGMMTHPHHAKVTPKFAKQYAQVGNVISNALNEFRNDVLSKNFPSSTCSPYKMNVNEVNVLIKELEVRGYGDVCEHVINAVSNSETMDVESGVK